MHNLQGQFDGFQFLIKDLNSTKDSTFRKAVGIEFHIKGPKYFMEFLPKHTVFTCRTEKSNCDLVCLLLPRCKNKLNISVGARPFDYTFPVQVEYFYHGQKMAYFSPRECQTKTIFFITNFSSIKHLHKWKIFKLKFKLYFNKYSPFIEGQNLEHSAKYGYFFVSFTGHFEHVKIKFQASVYIFYKMLDIISLLYSVIHYISPQTFMFITRN